MTLPDIYNTFKNDELSAYANIDKLEISTPGGGNIRHDSNTKKFSMKTTGQDYELINQWGHPSHELSLERIKETYDLTGFSFDIEEIGEEE